MTRRRPCPPAPGPLEAYAAAFDPLFATLAQRRSFREYLQGLLLPRDRNKTLTALAGAEPVVGAQAAAVQRLQWFLSEAPWDAEAINARRVARLLGDPATAPHAAGALVIDDTGDRKKGHHTAHVGRQYLGSVGKLDVGIVAVTSLWADERVFYPLHVRPYTPARRLPKGLQDPAFRTKPQLAIELVAAARAAGVGFRAVVADSAYGDNLAFAEALDEAGVPFVLALKPAKGIWAPFEGQRTPEEVARALPWGGPRRPGPWAPVVRRFRDGHAETWWAAELEFAGYGPDQTWRALAATPDPARLPPRSTWYLTTNLPRPGSPRAAGSPAAPAELTEVVRLYGLRTWVEQGYRQVKGELGWADFQVRTDRAIRRHWHLVGCAFAFCWRAWFAAAESNGQRPSTKEAREPGAGAGRGERRGPRRRAQGPILAGGAPPGARLAGSVGLPGALLARVVESAPATGTRRVPPPRRGGRAHLPLCPHLTN